MATGRTSLAVDVGGTKVIVAIVDEAGSVHARVTMATHDPDPGFSVRRVDPI